MDSSTWVPYTDVHEYPMCVKSEVDGLWMRKPTVEELAEGQAALAQRVQQDYFLPIAVASLRAKRLPLSEFQKELNRVEHASTHRLDAPTFHQDECGESFSIHYDIGPAPDEDESDLPESVYRAVTDQLLLAHCRDDWRQIVALLMHLGDEDRAAREQAWGEVFEVLVNPDPTQLLRLNGELPPPDAYSAFVTQVGTGDLGARRVVADSLMTVAVVVADEA